MRYVYAARSNKAAGGVSSSCSITRATSPQVLASWLLLQHALAEAWNGLTGRGATALEGREQPGACFSFSKQLQPAVPAPRLSTPRLPPRQ